MIVRRLALVVGFALAAAACAACAGAPEPVETAAAPGLLAGEVATVNGETIDLGSLEGQDVVLWFWAPW
ncbi:MAG: hypothetical protein AAF467_14620 [Actinomycetota bacterium]